LEPYIEYWRCRREKLRCRDQRLTQEAFLALDKIKNTLVNQFGAQRIIVFGSLAKGRFREGSDIDVAVEGIPHGQFFQALTAVNRETESWVDLKPWEDLDTHFRQRILTTGKIIYAGDDGN
jgi:predicted nucleotidyltransferase